MQAAAILQTGLDEDSRPATKTAPLAMRRNMWKSMSYETDFNRQHSCSFNLTELGPARVECMLGHYDLGQPKQ